jgi:two-component system, response regulator PhcR
VTQATLLIVDDDEVLLHGLARGLRAHYRTLIACCAPEALEVLQQERVDLILSDYHMPGMTGLELMQKVALTRPDAVRILCSAEPDADMAIKAVNQGDVFRILEKPLTLAEVKVVLHLGLEKLRLERENRILRALVAAHPELEAEFQARMERSWPGFAPSAHHDAQEPGQGPARS